MREIRAVNDRIAARGLRVLALAFKPATAPEEPTYDELVLAGLVALTDPIRPGVAEAIRACRSGRHPDDPDHRRSCPHRGRDLPRAGARQRRSRGSSTPRASSELGPEDAAGKLVRDVDVFARVSPADKYRIVRALQAGATIVAMTGDGINDAAALRAADVGVAMGARGTDVARDVADVVLMDDDFDGIVAAIDQGRTIHRNIGKALRFLLATNFSEILVTLGALAVGIPRPMSAIQFLWINLLSDVAPALALAIEPAEPDVMTRPPRDPHAPILPRASLIEIARDASILGATALAVHGLALARYGAGARATSVAFSTLTIGQLLHALNYRSRRASTGGSVLTGTVALSVAAQVGAMTLPPLRGVLGLTPLGLADWALVLGGAAVPVLVGEMARRGRVDDARGAGMPEPRRM